MTTPTLEDTIRDLAKRGEISHFSLTPSQEGKKWRASFTMCSHFGVSFSEDTDPVQALMLAFTSAKLRKPRVKIDLKATEVETTIAADAASREVDEHIAGDPLADLM